MNYLETLKTISKDRLLETDSDVRRNNQLTRFPAKSWQLGTVWSDSDPDQLQLASAWLTLVPEILLSRSPVPTASSLPWVGVLTAWPGPCSHQPDWNKNRTIMNLLNFEGKHWEEIAVSSPNSVVLHEITQFKLFIQMKIIANKIFLFYKYSQ